MGSAGSSLASSGKPARACWCAWPRCGERHSRGRQDRGPAAVRRVSYSEHDLSQLALAVGSRTAIAEGQPCRRPLVARRGASSCRRGAGDGGSARHPDQQCWNRHRGSASKTDLGAAREDTGVTVTYLRSRHVHGYNHGGRAGVRPLSTVEDGARAILISPHRQRLRGRPGSISTACVRQTRRPKPVIQMRVGASRR